MENQTFEFEVKMTAGELWHFSLYHVNKGYLGVFNLLFTLASAYLLIMGWGKNDTAPQLLLVLCVCMFTVIQPAQLYLKAKKQASMEAMKLPIHFVFTREQIHITQGEQSQELTWEQIVKVEGNREMLMIYMDRIHAYLLPETMMDGKREEFCAMLREILPKERRKRI